MPRGLRARTPDDLFARPLHPYTEVLNRTQKYVASTTLEEPLPWENSTLLKGDVPGEVAKLKEGPGKEIQVIGSGELVQTLIREGFVDEYQLMVHPIVLGTGKKLFRDGADAGNLELIESKATTKGVLIGGLS